MPKRKRKSKTRLKRTNVPGVYRHQNGSLWVRARVGSGRRLERSLHTDDLETARERAPRQLIKLRAAASALSNQNISLGEAAEIYLDSKLQDSELKPRAKDYREETVGMIRRHWVGFDDLEASAVSALDCERFASKLRSVINRRGKTYYAGRVNGALESLRGILDVAVKAGAIERNPALPENKRSPLKRMRVPAKDRDLPAPELFAAILARLDALPSRRHAALALRGLAFTGMRPNEAAHCVPQDLNLPGLTLRVRVTKNGRERTIHLTTAAAELFQAHPFDVFAAFKKSPRKALATVCRELNIARLTPYDFRHFFSQRMREAHVDISAAADTLGHQDKGRTMLKTYTHPDVEFLKREMARVRFTST